MQTLHREALEETGWIIAPERRLGAFQHYTYMPEYNLWARKVCHIYICKGILKKSNPLHKEHTPTWVSPMESLDLLCNSGDKHYVALAMSLRYL